MVTGGSEITGADNVGGIVGVKGGTIRLASSFASVVGDDNVGGLVGTLDGRGYIDSGKYRSDFHPFL